MLDRFLDQNDIPAAISDEHFGPRLRVLTLRPRSGFRLRKLLALREELSIELRGRASIEADPAGGAIRVMVAHDAPQDIAVRVGGDGLHLGSDVLGRPAMLDLWGAPHVLVGGTTGSGKTTLLRALAGQLLWRGIELRVIDMKGSEFADLGVRAISDPGEAGELLEEEIGAVDAFFRRPTEVRRRVLIIDELADLVLRNRRGTEDRIARLAAKGRAAGLHLICATQRPSVDVVTGLIKANLPCRIALRTRTATDSRVILDEGGAEALLGNGDGLAGGVRFHGGRLTAGQAAAVRARVERRENGVLVGRSLIR